MWPLFNYNYNYNCLTLLFIFIRCGMSKWCFNNQKRCSISLVADFISCFHSSQMKVFRLNQNDEYERLCFLDICESFVFIFVSELWATFRNGKLYPFYVFELIISTFTTWSHNVSEHFTLEILSKFQNFSIVIIVFF